MGRIEGRQEKAKRNNRIKERNRKNRKMARIEECKNMKQFWEIIREFRGRKERKRENIKKEAFINNFRVFLGETNTEIEGNERTKEGNKVEGKREEEEENEDLER